MSEYSENLGSGEVGAVFEELGLVISVSMDDLIKSYEGWKWTLMRHEEFPVILNVLPGDGVSGKHFWEEWYIQNGKVHHHILTLDEPEAFDEIFICPESDDIHPPEVWGKTWYVQDRTSMEPLLIPSVPAESGVSEKISKTIEYTYSTILRAKIRNFRKRSLLKYAFASLIYAAGLTIIRGGSLLSPGTAFVFINFFLIFICLSFILMFVSSGILAGKYKGWKMVYTFSEQGIHVKNEMNGQEEEHGWDWVLSHELTEKTLFLKIRSRTPFEVILNRDRMSEGELENLLDWLKS